MRQPLRFIPAGAGNTRPQLILLKRLPVHPRRRGEHAPQRQPIGNDSGSSPQARGTPHAHATQPRPRRFIPAGAGNTWAQGRRSPLHTVHPRRRGEHQRVSWSASTPPGSSPQARGTRRETKPKDGRKRFIPAGAGNTQDATAPTATKPVHPRRRGEHCAVSRGSRRFCGSSPQARGTQIRPLLRIFVGRFIPAGAGNTNVTFGLAASYAVHPRRRGEH